MATSQDAVQLVEHFLCGPAAEFGPYSPLDEDEPLQAEELFPSRLYRLRMVDVTEQSVDVQVFLGIEEMGGLLWEQDVRALLRLAGSPHPALPEVLDGGYRTDEQTRTAGVPGGMAFVATRGGIRSAGPKDVDYFRAHPADAFREFRSLAEGLAELHFLGFSHRNISPASIDVFDGPRMRLARFELSSLIADLFRATVDSTADAAELRGLFVRDASNLAYAPPERAAFLRGADANLVEDEHADVYGLAAVVWEWFLGPFPADLIGLLPDGASDSATAADARDAHRAFSRQLQQAVRESAAAPVELAAILARMLDSDPDARPSADEVLGLVTAGYDRIMSDIEGPVAAGKHLMIFMPEESAETIFKWGLVNYNPTTDEGRRELAAFIATDMRGAHMTHSPSGAEPFVRGRTLASIRDARQVIRGEQLVWFCDYYRPRDEHGNLEGPTEQALLIKYVVLSSIPTVMEKLKGFTWTSARLVPELELRAMDIDREVLTRRIARAPSWRDLVDATRPRTTDSPSEVAFREAIAWLLDYQDVELAARMYPFERAASEVTNDILVHYDTRRDQRRIIGSPVFVKYAATPALRPEFGQFFSALEDDDGDRDVDVLEDRAGRPGRVRLTTAQVVRREGQDRVVLRRKRGEPAIPERGWLRPAGDRGAQQSLDRQRDASFELYRAKHLQGYLRDPRTIRTFEHHWQNAGAGLMGDGPAVVREILVCEPFCAVQGPPGTGKTRVAAAAIAAYLRRDPAARILVSAQSNFALDNLAVRVLKEIGEMDEDGRPARQDDDRLRPVALRVTTRGIGAQGRVDKAVQPWRRLDAADRTSAQIRAHVERRLIDLTPAALLPSKLLSVLDQWTRMLGGQEESIVPELADRLHRGANLVFATCAASTPELLSPTSETVFNWVLVEEAAKAWPTELAMPLVRGLRWTLIGDHFQLPAHRREDLKRFLDACAADPNPLMAHITTAKAKDYLNKFDMFGQLFARPEDPKQPLRRMSVQFRMREPIGELVSRVFYPAEDQPRVPVPGALPVGGLQTYIDPDPARRIPPVHLSAPAELDGHSIVWLDTAGITSCRNEPHWWNPGEAAVVLRLLDRLKPFPKPNHDGFGPSPLAVLTPYREQLRLLEGSSLAAPYLSTVHAFQGREADMVIVSLVRDRVPGGVTGPHAVQAGLGHLAQRQLANVLFSRARRQLVIVGRFAHYARIMGPVGFWSKVCRAVERYGTILSAYDLFGDLPGLVAPRDIGNADVVDAS